MYKHRIILKNFDLEAGSISFSKLRELQDRLASLAEGAVLSLVEGRSKHNCRKFVTCSSSVTKDLML
jgi:hypothetical protein